MHALRLRHFNVLALVSLTGAAGCTGDIGGVPLADGPPPPPDVEPLEVPASPEILQASGTCTALRAGERLVSVSPEGHAWLEVPGEGLASIRVLDALEASGMGEVVEEIELSELSQVQAWTNGDAAVLTADGLWRLEELARIELTPPEGFGAPAVFCGDPSTNGFVLAAGQLFERRADGLWWGWDPGAEGDTAPSAVLPYDGDCQSRDDVVWMTSADGTLWKVEPTEYSQPLRFESLVHAAVTEDIVAVLESDRLWIGPDAWQPWIFPNATPSALSASNGLVWMVSGDQLLRFDGETYVEVAHTLDAPIESVTAYAGGVWLVGGDSICHQAVAPVVRVDGLRPYSRSTELSYDFSVETSDPDADVSADLNGEALELTWDDTLGVYTGRARLDHAGWHELSFVAAGSEETADRSLLVKRLPEVSRSWETDIRPIYEASCTGAACHEEGASGNAPDLSSYEAWKSFADPIRDRVVEAGSMPPVSSRGPEWGDDKVQIIAEWIEGGRQP